MKPRVFILQDQSKYDISAVKYYSNKLVFIVDRERINPFDIYEFTSLIKHRLTVEHFNPEIDLICLTGSSIMLSLFLATIVHWTNGYSNLKVLIYDARNSKYKLRILNFGG